MSAPGLSAAAIRAAIARAQEATYEPPPSLHHPDCPNMAPGSGWTYDTRHATENLLRCTPGCAP